MRLLLCLTCCSLVLLGVIIYYCFATQIHKPIEILETASKPPNTRSRVTITGFVYSSLAPEKKDPIGDAIVYLGATEACDSTPSSEPVIAKIKKGQLVPDYIGVSVGQKLVIEGEDHELYLLLYESSEILGEGSNLPDQLGRWERVFLKPSEYIAISCVIHPTFRGVITVVPNPAYTKTRRDGTFQLDLDLPPGNYQLRAYHPKQGRSAAKLVLKPNENSTAINLFLPN